MMLSTIIDVAPDPVSSGVALAVVLFVIAFVILLFVAAALVLFLWYRKRSMRHKEMIRPPNEV